MPSWSRCWSGKAWSRSTDTIQAPLSLIHIHLMHKWGLRPKIILSEARHTTKSILRWLIFTRINDHSGANLGVDFAINMPHGALYTCIEAWKDFSTVIEWRVTNYRTLYPLISSYTAYILCTRYPTYHSQIAWSDAKLKQMLVRKDMILVHGYHPNNHKPPVCPYNA